jgi:predicted DNA-binding WGR domain protein
MLDDVALNINTAPTKKYYVMKIMKNIGSVAGAPAYIIALKWGKIRNKGSTVVHWEDFSNAEEAEKAFKVKFSEKTFTDWEDRENFSHIDGGYRIASQSEIMGTGGNIFHRMKKSRINPGAMEEENTLEQQMTRKERERKEWKYKFKNLDQKVFTEISNLNFEISHVMRTLFSISEADKLLSDIGVDKKKLDLTNLTSGNINNGHLILNDIQNEL